MTISSSLPLLWKRLCCNAVKEHVGVLTIAVLHGMVETGKQKQISSRLGEGRMMCSVWLDECLLKLRDANIEVAVRALNSCVLVINSTLPHALKG